MQEGRINSPLTGVIFLGARWAHIQKAKDCRGQPKPLTIPDISTIKMELTIGLEPPTC
jgi:hypothetical protein